MKSLSLIVTSLAFGGLSFWAPTLIFFPPTTSERVWLIVASLASPLAIVAFSALALRMRRSGGADEPSTCLFALIGLWLTGPWLMTLAAALRTPDILRNMGPADYSYLVLMSFLPPYTLYVSAAQGSGYGLILATILLPICHRVFEKGRWVIPPTWKRRISFWGSRSVG